jgi:endonuclease/exonuclease/phosphatase (EEP) superfamily protein YafD
VLKRIPDADIEVEPPAAQKPKRRRHSRGKLLCLLGFLAGVGGLSTHWLARAYLYFDFFNNLTLQFALLAAACAIGYFMPRARVLTAMVLTIAGLLAISFWPQYLSEQPHAVAKPAANERALRLMAYNTWSQNDDWQKVVEEVKRVDPDIVTLVEFGREKRQALAALNKLFPYVYHCMNERHCHRAIMSKHKLYNVKFRDNWQGPDDLIARLGPEFGRAHIFGIHSTRPPFVRSQIKQIQYYADHLRKYSGSKIVMGDFNSTPFSVLLTGFTERSGLDRLTNLPTYPATFGPFPQLAIDHVFVSKDIRTLSKPRIGHTGGSDHYPVIVDVAIPVK